MKEDNIFLTNENKQFLNNHFFGHSIVSCECREEEDHAYVRITLTNGYQFKILSPGSKNIEVVLPKFFPVAEDGSTETSIKLFDKRKILHGNSK